jgi:hypothetical protein
LERQRLFWRPAFRYSVEHATVKLPQLLASEQACHGAPFDISTKFQGVRIALTR